MRELERMLNQEEGSLADVVRVDIHLADLKDISAMDAIYSEFFGPGCYPARTCTESPSICGGSRLEITLMAKCVRFIVLATLQHKKPTEWPFVYSSLERTCFTNLPTYQWDR